MAGPTKRPGLSLYGNLLAGDAPGGSNVISSAPVTYTPEQQAELAKKKTDAPFGNLKPRISRPQQQQKARVKQTPAASSLINTSNVATSSSHKFSSSTVTESSSFADPSPDKVAAKQPASNFQKTTFDDFMTNEQYDDVDYDPRHKRGKGGRNKRRKKDNASEVKHVWSWDDVYDPAFPNKYGDFKGSDEQVKANSDWKARLYYQKMREAERKRRTSALATTRDSEESDHPRSSKPSNSEYSTSSQL
nr:hypothetical protein CFP56_16561 [Quercus suber]